MNLRLRIAKVLKIKKLKIFLKKVKKGIDKSKLMWYNVQVVRKTNAGMAQSVEHVIGNDEVISSILITSSTKTLAIARVF